MDIWHGLDTDHIAGQRLGAITRNRDEVAKGGLFAAAIVFPVDDPLGAISANASGEFWNDTVSDDSIANWLNRLSGPG